LELRAIFFRVSILYISQSVKPSSDTGPLFQTLSSKRHLKEKENAGLKYFSMLVDICKGGPPREVLTKYACTFS